MSFADSLKKISDSVHSDKFDKETQSLYDSLIKKAKAEAVKGSYSIDLYDNRLLNSTVASALKQKLKEDGFKVTIAEDYHYTQHSGETQMYVRINWE